MHTQIRPRGRRRLIWVCTIRLLFHIKEICEERIYSVFVTVSFEIEGSLVRDSPEAVAKFLWHQSGAYAVASPVPPAYGGWAVSRYNRAKSNSTCFVVRTVKRRNGPRRFHALVEIRRYTPCSIDSETCYQLNRL